MEPIQLRDFLDYTYISDVRTSQKHIAYVASICDIKENEYKNKLYIDHEEVTFLGKDKTYLFINDQTILFSNILDSKDKEAKEKGEERTVFYTFSLESQKIEKSFMIPLNVISIKQVKEGIFVLLVDYDLEYSSMYTLTDLEKQAILERKKEEQDYEVLDELPFYGNGLGYTNKKRNTLFLYDQKENQLTQISSKYYQVSSFEVVNNKIYYFGNEYTQVKSIKHSIHVYDIEVQLDTEVLAQKEYAIQDIIYFNDALLVMAKEQKSYGLNENVKFYYLDEKNNTLSLFADNEEALASSVGSDCRYGKTTYRTIIDNALYFITTRINSSHIYKLDIDGNIEAILTKDGSVDSLASIENQLIFTAMYDGRLQEVYSYDIRNKDLKQQTAFNEEFKKTKDIRPFEEITFTRDGYTLYGWVLTPSNYDPNKKYPAILDIHGGPKTVYGEVFYHEMQVWANLGYFVFFMNPRGSDGRGNDFMDIRGKYGTGDYDDLMMFTDVVIEKYPSIDTNRLGITGGSYGGFMTNWIIGHTSRFKAAASQRSIANWVSFAHTSDIGLTFGKDQQQASTWENVEKLWWHSPLKYANQCTTPTLFIHSDEDYRCPYSEGLQMYSALMEHGVDTRLVMFKKENHELSRSGKPRHRIRRLEEITNWMNKYLK